MRNHPQVPSLGRAFGEPCGIHVWRNPAEGGVRAYGVVKGFDIRKNRRLRRGTGRKIHQVHQLALEAAEEIFGYSIVVGIAPAAHALADALPVQRIPVALRGILDAPVAIIPNSA
jgi:hypothetical protein